MLIANGNELPWWAYAVFFTALLAFALFARNRDAGFWERLLKNDRVARCVGLITIAFGLGLAFMLVYSPLTDALGHKRTISLHLGAVGLPAILVFVGAIQLLAGKQSYKFVLTRHSQEPTVLQHKMILIGVVTSLACEVGLYFVLYELGYSIR